MLTRSCRRVQPQTPPFTDYAAGNTAQPWNDEPRWPCSWVRLEDAPSSPFVVAYRLRFRLEAARCFRVHVSGDERYEFFVDGERVGRGPARAPRGHCHYETYELELSAGEHILSARVHSLGKLAPWAQTTFGHGWLLAPEPEDLWDDMGTGRAGWEAKLLPGFSFHPPSGQMDTAMGCGLLVEIDGVAYNWDWQQAGDGWAPVEVGPAGNNGQTLYFRAMEPLLFPTQIPPMQAELQRHARLRDHWSRSSEAAFPLQFNDLSGIADQQRWVGLLSGEGVTIEPHHKLRVLLDFEDYVAAFPSLTTTGGNGAVIRLGWSEALVDEASQKGKRDVVAGRYWQGLTDTFRPDGGTSRVFDTLWWRCGRYLKLEVETGAEPLLLESLALKKTGYPLNVSAQWNSGNPDLDAVFGLCLRSLEACMHETYMDCPFYEQLQYLGDTRLQILLTYALSNDDRLAREALTAFAIAQRNSTGWMPSNHPSSIGQRIATFPLWWVAMLHDFARWRGDREFVQALLPTARQVVQLWLDHLQENGLVASPEGWNFVDWVDHLGNAGGKFHGVLNWQLVYTLRHLGELEAWCDEPELAARMHRLANSIAAACTRFWNPERGLYADDLEHTLFSEHANCLALLSGLVGPEQRAQLEKSLFDASDLTRCSIYFSHYLFEAAAAAGRVDVIENRLAPWLELPGRGFVTTPETFEGARSDCHAWGAHPLFHFFASTLGIQPASWGFESVVIAPQPGALQRASGRMSHPRGEILVELQREGDGLQGQITLPAGVSGTFQWGSSPMPLHEGLQVISAPGSASRL